MTDLPEFFYKSYCSTTGIITLIEPWKEEKLANQYEKAECETVTIIYWNEP